MIKRLLIEDLEPLFQRRTYWRKLKVIYLSGTEIPPQLDDINNEQLNYWLSRLVTEAQSLSGKCYNSGILYGMCSGLQRFIHEKRAMSSVKKELNILYKGHQFALFKMLF